MATSAIANATNILINTANNALNDALTVPSFSNPAETSILSGGIVAELNAPSLPNGGFFYTAGSQTTPGLSRGALHNSSLATNNADLSHVCDFKFVFVDGINLAGLINPIVALQNAVKNGKMAAANAIRAAINQLQQGFRALVTAALAVLCQDPTGQVSLSVSVGKYYVRLINEAINKAAQVVFDVSLIVNLVQDLQQIVTYIKSLPSQLQQILKDCLTNFQNSFASSVNASKNATQIKNVVNQAVYSATGNANQFNSTANTAVLNAITGTLTQSDITALSSHITSTVAAAPPSSGATQKTTQTP